MFEDRKVKAEAIAKAQAVIGENVDLRVQHLDAADHLARRRVSKDPAQFIGVHFFSPVERMMLVEIILGKKTGDAALAVALDYVRAIRKTPIVVNDSRGFYTSRVVGTYIREGHLMLTEGVPAAMIENVGAHGRHAGRAALAQRRGGGRSRLENPQGDRSRSRRRRPIDPRQKALLRGDGREARPLRPQERQGLLRLSGRTGRSGCGPASPTCRRRSSIPTRSTSRSSSTACSAMQALETARCFEEGVHHRRARGRRRLDPRLRLRAVLRRHAVLHRHDGHQELSSQLCRKLEKKYGARFAPNKLLIDLAA